jgi:hypothetical protein
MSNAQRKLFRGVIINIGAGSIIALLRLVIPLVRRSATVSLRPGVVLKRALRYVRERCLIVAAQ